MIVENLRIVAYGDYRNNWHDTVEQTGSHRIYIVPSHKLIPMRDKVSLFYAEKKALTPKENDE